LDATP
jgi:hypothetical protein